MLVGQIMLASPVFLPAILGWWHWAPLLQALHELGCPLGRMLHSDALDAAIASHGAALDAGAGAGGCRQAYNAAAVGFFVALFCLDARQCPDEVDAGGVVRRDHVHGRSAPRGGVRLLLSRHLRRRHALGHLRSASAAQAFGWHIRIRRRGGWHERGAGLLPAAGSALARCDWAASGPAAPRRATPSAMPPRRARGKERAGPAASACYSVLAACCAPSASDGSSCSAAGCCTSRSDVNRAVGSFVIPVPWFTSINAAVVIVLAPMVAAFWVRLGTRNQRVDIVQKYAFALAMVMIGHVLMYLAARHATPAAPASVWIPLIALSMLGMGEIVAWTATYGMVSRAAPAGFASVAMGAWYLLTFGLGGYLSGFTGACSTRSGFAAAFGTVAAIMGAACVIALLLRASAVAPRCPCRRHALARDPAAWMPTPTAPLPCAARSVPSISFC